MRVRDPESKKRRLLDAALAEFAERGLSGARIDRIAHRARCSAGLVYTYFGSKEDLFDAVLDDITARTVDQAPIDPQDLPGYAVRLYDLSAANPEVERFVSWYQLERASGGDTDSTVTAAMRQKIDAVAAAQVDGTISSRLDPAELVLAVQSISRMWFTQPGESLDAVEPHGDHAARRKTIRDIVSALVDP
ncbi:TetR/AcrR family transcriptional regulator [Actinoalloteichus hymeniacidonis]|uniref:Transcriptional regulator, TetR family n=1 Tax=Actinoalloteichus hymeniacidonis TaxID=340345 RepID=A0AAC9HR26_9PSEU|nr:TetR/AcrR family transcriptional regulator [Actinoalloteichus hymeniacidonis]AOS63758.1 transcriptional regulator, TetR family [Actinoalloteichus hymeniacidonis]MBB5908188.1 AcrR family transcriptional regulator [Actinoalloteichus hymeniacidonis]